MFISNVRKKGYFNKSLPNIMIASESYDLFRNIK